MVWLATSAVAFPSHFPATASAWLPSKLSGVPIAFGDKKRHSNLVRLWGPGQPARPVFLLGPSLTVQAFTVAGDGKSLALGCTMKPRAFGILPRANQIRSFPGHVSGVQDLALSRNGKRLATLSTVTENGSATARAWDVATGEVLFRTQGRQGGDSQYDPVERRQVPGNRSCRRRALW